MLGLYNGKDCWIFPIEWDSGRPYGHHIAEAQRIIDDHDLIIGANLKHDLLWTRRYGIKTQHKRAWCLQYAEFCLSGQTWRMPDLDTACKARGLPGKTTHIAEAYWSKGKEINEAPWEEAEAYNRQDLEIEFGLFKRQVDLLESQQQIKRLIWNGSQDLHITAEMEWNGLKYDHDQSLRDGHRILESVGELEVRFRGLVPSPHISPTSPRHVSAVLYGGQISYDESEAYTFTYANPKRPAVTKYRKVQKQLTLPRLVQPLRGSETDTGFSTEEGTLKRLHATGDARKIIDLLLDMRGLNKLVGTYYHGIPKLAREMNWENNIIHGQLHHCVTQTGRLSSSRPNQQNIDYGVRSCLITRFPLKKS